MPSLQQLAKQVLFRSVSFVCFFAVVFSSVSRIGNVVVTNICV